MVIIFDHHIFADASGWTKITSLNHPTLCVMLWAHESDYATFGYKYPRIDKTQIVVVADSGAQSCLWSRREFLASGFTEEDLIPVSHSMKTANRSQITIDGAVLVIDLLVPPKVVTKWKHPEAQCFYLSKEAMVHLF